MGETGASEKEGLRKLFVGGITIGTSDDTFKDHFGQYGNIVDSVIIRDNQTKKSKGFGFVTYDSISGADSALGGRPHNIDGREVEIKRAIPRDDQSGTGHIRTKKMFIGGVSVEATDADVKNYIESRYPGRGTVVTVNLISDKETQKKKGFGFLDLDSEDFADYIVIEEPRPWICGKKCELKKAEPKGGVQGGRGGRGGRGGGRGSSRGGGGGGYGSPGGFGGGSYGGNTGYGMNAGYGVSAGYGDTYSQGYGATYGGYGGATGYGGYGGGGADYSAGYGAAAGGYGAAAGGYGAGGFGGQKPAGRGAARYKPY